MKKWTETHPVVAFGFAVMVALAAPGLAVAGEGDSGEDGGDSEPSDAKQAQKAFEEGVAHYQKGEYADAIVDFRKGHELVPNPKFLVNVAMSQMYLGKPKRFLDTTNKILESEGDLSGDSHSKTQSLRAGGRTVLRARDIASKIGDKQKAEEDDSGGDSASGPEPRASSSSGGFGAAGWAGVVSATLGAGGLVGTGLVASSLSDDWNDLEELRTTPGSKRDFEDKQETIESKQLLGQILLYTGSGLTAVGTGLIVVGALTGGSGSGGSAASFMITPDGRIVFSFAW